MAIVGYTNAGKSTLLNALTGADVLAEDKLFATLDTRSRTLRCGWAGWGEREVVVTDTVGFIRNLPKDLFAAFRATFEEAADADLLLHVVDASDPARDDHVRTVMSVLEELELLEIPRLLVCNKIDLAEPGRAAAARARAPGRGPRQRDAPRDDAPAHRAHRARALAEKWDAQREGPERGAGGEGRRRPRRRRRRATRTRWTRCCGPRASGSVSRAV